MEAHHEGRLPVAGRRVHTVAIESEDAARVIATVRELGPNQFPNFNYLRGLKALANMTV